jgi:hypothetical protein
MRVIVSEERRVCSQPHHFLVWKKDTEAAFKRSTEMPQFLVRIHQLHGMRTMSINFHISNQGYCS